MHAFVDAVGHSPVLPQWGLGYWHSKNRYATQQQITDAAAGFASRGINVSVIVVDYNHWPRVRAITLLSLDSTCAALLTRNRSPTMV